MFVFHGERCVVGRELVGTKTCGSTLSSACSRSFIAYLAKSAAVAYGEVDCSSPLAAPTITRVKQTAKSLFMCKIAATLLSDDMHLGKAFSILKKGVRLASFQTSWEGRTRIQRLSTVSCLNCRSS